MAIIYPTLTASPYENFEPYQSILVGLIVDGLDRNDVWLEGDAAQCRAYVQQLIELIVNLPPQDEP